MNEDDFQRWYALIARHYGLNQNPDAPQHHYDYRGAYREGANPFFSGGHWPSSFKTETHPNRFVGGMDTRSGQPVTSELARRLMLQHVLGVK